MQGSKKNVKERVSGNWFHTLVSLGISESYLKNKHGPCPLCGGKDRYRWDNKDGRGTYYCQCGPGDGFQLLMKFNNWTFPETAQRIEELLEGPILKQKQLPTRKKSDAGAFIKRILDSAQPVKEGDPVSEYLRGRGLNQIPKNLMFHRDLWEADTKKTFMGMVAKVQNVNGELVSLHRTFLKDGGKALIDSPRKLITPIGTLNGAAIRLYPAKEILGIAEGIETSIAAHELFQLPVWAMMNTNGIKTFEPPEEVKRILIFGDNDKNFAGQKAAYHAANKLTLKGYQVKVNIPDTPGNDWLNEFCKEVENVKEY